MQIYPQYRCDLGQLLSPPHFPSRCLFISVVNSLGQGLSYRASVLRPAQGNQDLTPGSVSYCHTKMKEVDSERQCIYLFSGKADITNQLALAFIQQPSNLLFGLLSFSQLLW